MSDKIATVLFISLCACIMWLHARAEVVVTICQAHGNMLILESRELEDLGATVDMSEMECVTRTMRNAQLWRFRSAYKRASGTR